MTSPAKALALAIHRSPNRVVTLGVSDEMAADVAREVALLVLAEVHPPPPRPMGLAQLHVIRQGYNR